ncbi:MAG TPA: cytochrome c oxidase subunit 3 [Humisphaera sp.]
MADYAVQFVAEEHAPDPVHSRGDPTLPGKIGIWLFLASEIMFFVAILGSYVIFRAGSPNLFAKNAETLNKWLAGTNTVVLIFSSLTMALAVAASQKGNARRAAIYLGVTIACAFGFMTIKFFEYKSKFGHYTFRTATSVQASADAPKKLALTVYDGHLHTEADGSTKFTGYKYVWPDKPAPAATAPATAPVPAAAAQGPNLFQLTEADFKALAARPGPDKAVYVEDEAIDPATILEKHDYGPSKNVFFSSYFTLTGIHGIHVIGGIIPLSFLLVQALRGKTFPRHTEYTGLYWHFVDLVWIFLFPLLYLI